MRPMARILVATFVASLIIACTTAKTASEILDSEPKNQVEVIKVIDGDTLDVLIAGIVHRVRLFGVDTPERGEGCYYEATERLRQLAGDLVRIEPGPRTEDTYGRLLFYLYTPSGESIDEMMVREGFAMAWTRDGQHRDVLVAAEEEARRDGRGCLW